MTRMKVLYLGGLQTECTHESGAKIITEAPSVGKGSFWPTDLFAASLGTCMLTLMAMAAEELKMDFKGATFEIEKTMSTEPPRRIDKLILRFRSPLSLNGAQREKLEKAALNCPVHLALHPNLKVEVDFVWGI
ncbi:MAG TPA: OsmC family protein [Chlamydiales bacterium]|nr:OsmC family protein [Chlamydiales bacterium]